MKTPEILYTRTLTTPDGQEYKQHIWNDARRDFRDMCGNPVPEPETYEYKNEPA